MMGILMPPVLRLWAPTMAYLWPSLWSHGTLLLCLLLMVQWKAEANSLGEMMVAPHTVPPVQPPPTLTTQGKLSSLALSPPMTRSPAILLWLLKLDTPHSAEQLPWSSDH